MFVWPREHVGVVDPRLFESLFPELASEREFRRFLAAAFPEPVLLACAELETFVRSGRIGLRAQGIVAILGGGILVIGDAEFAPIDAGARELYLTARTDLAPVVGGDDTVRVHHQRPVLLAEARAGSLPFARFVGGAAGAPPVFDRSFWPRLARIDADPRSRDLARALRVFNTDLSPATRRSLARADALSWDDLLPILIAECEGANLWTTPLESMEEIGDGALGQHVVRCLEPLHAGRFPGVLRGGALRWIGPIEPVRRTLLADEEHALFHAPELGQPGEAWLAVIVRGSGAGPAQVRAEPGARSCEVFPDRPAVIAPWNPEGEDLRVHLRGAQIARAGVYVQSSG